MHLFEKMAYMKFDREIESRTWRHLSWKVRNEI